MITGIDAITYSTDQWDAARQFLNDWGLQELAFSSSVQCFETLSGAQVLVRRPDDPALAPAMEAGPTLREVVWGVDSDADLDLLAKSLPSPIEYSTSSYENSSNQPALSGANAPPSYDAKAPRRVAALDPHGLRIVFQRSTQRSVAVQGAPSNPYGNAQRINTPSPVYERATPIEIGHVVLFTDKLAEAVRFYEALGFVLSDSYPGRGAFLRCAPTGGHHDLFLLQVPGKATGLNHVAFTVRDIHEVFGGGLAMGRAGWKTQLGPGRHPISSAYFWYFDNPCGGLIEYNADEDHLTQAWQAREFTPGPTVFAEWAIDGGIDGHTRRQTPPTTSTPASATASAPTGSAAPGAPQASLDKPSADKPSAERPVFLTEKKP
jgi:catechol 2,3-dioxygenase-like lactoylglutathione lyase family enzyme